MGGLQEGKTDISNVNLTDAVMNITFLLPQRLTTSIAEVLVLTKEISSFRLKRFESLRYLQQQEMFMTSLLMLLLRPFGS